MTERDWLTHNADPRRMLDFITGRGTPTPADELLPQASHRPEGPATPRQLRLIACAFCRWIWPLMVRHGVSSIVATAEEYADGNASAAELAWAYEAGRELVDATRHSLPVGLWAAVHAGWRCARGSGFGGQQVYAVLIDSHQGGCMAAEQSQAIRDVIRNPFDAPRRGSWAPGKWRRDVVTPDVLGMAAAAYRGTLPDGRVDNARLAVLSDALEEDGATEGVILGHLRSPAPHWRGCWALDLVLGRN